MTGHGGDKRICFIRNTTTYRLDVLWHTNTTHTDKLQLSRHQVFARFADKAQVLVFAISSPEILEIRTDGTCSNRGRLSGSARTTGPALSSANERIQWTRFPTIGCRPHVKDFWTIPWQNYRVKNLDTLQQVNNQKITFASPPRSVDLRRLDSDQHSITYCTTYFNGNCQVSVDGRIIRQPHN